jgi:hypothetical protein
VAFLDWNSLFTKIDISFHIGIINLPNIGKCDYKIGICCFSANHAALRRKSKNWLVQNQDNVSEWGNMFIGRLLVQ